MAYNNTRYKKANNGSRIALGVLIVLVSLFCFLSAVGALGGVGRMVYSFIIGFFGLAEYAYALVGIIIGLALIFNLRANMRPSKLCYYAGLFALGVLALQIYTSSAHIIDAGYGGYLLKCYNFTNTAGGMLFGILAFPLMKAITSVGALCIVCVLFFALAFFAFFPFIKKNVVYTSANKADRGVEDGQKLFARKAKIGNAIDAPRVAALTDFAAGSEEGQNLFVVDVEGDPLQRTSRRTKGADGYHPLFPNALGNIEDEERITNPALETSDKYSPKNFARDILFSQNPDDDSYDRFKSSENPKEAMNKVSPSYGTLRKNELINKLGIDLSAIGKRTTFNRQYSLSEDDNFADTNQNNLNSGSKIERGNREQSEQKYEKNENPHFDSPLSKSDFAALKQEQIQFFGEQFNPSVKPEFEAMAYDRPYDKTSAVNAEIIKKELVKPTRQLHKLELGDSINSTIEKAQNSVNPNGNLYGIQGAVNRAINKEEPQPQIAKKEIQADAYNESNLIGGERHDVLRNDVGQRRQTADGAQVQGAKIPRAFQDTSIYNQSNAQDIQKSANENRQTDFTPIKQIPDINKPQWSVQGAPQPQGFNRAPVNLEEAARSNRNGGEFKNRAESGASIKDMDADRTMLPQKGETFEQAEMRVKMEEIRKAGKEAPPLNKYEKEAALREEKMRAARDRGLQKTEQSIKKMSSVDASKERMTQVSIEQAISQVTPKSPYVAPPIRLLTPPDPPLASEASDEFRKKQIIADKLAFFDIKAEVTNVKHGPTFSLYTLKVEMPKGRTIGSLVSYEDDIAMALEEESVRILAPIPRQNAVGIEVPNKNRRIVRLSELITSPAFNQSKSPATFALGKNLYNTDYVCDIKSLPHMLIAGATGAGKSCCINSIIVSLLYKASPEDIRLILIDPKRIELSVYAGIPHLLLDEIVCDVDKAIRALNWGITEMTRRITFLSQMKYRDIDEYNADCEKLGYEKMPRIVIIVDELADLMAMGKKAVEDSINRLARLARAVGIHLILATQRPSVDVVSGTIKNNLPSRVAFKVTSGPDSRTILDAYGADKLLGNGDMLYMMPKAAIPERMQGAFISNAEVKDIVDFIKQNNESYFDSAVKDAIFKEKEDEKIENDKDKEQTGKSGRLTNEVIEAIQFGIDCRNNNNSSQFSISLIQRKWGYGFNRAARIHDVIRQMDLLEPYEKNDKFYQIRITQDELDELIENNREEDND